MELRILGPLELRDDEGRSVPLGRPKERMLLAALLTRDNRTATIDALAVTLWEDDLPGSAVNLVQGYVSKLRRALAAATEQDGLAIATSPAGYRLDLGSTQLDADRFVILVQRGLDLHDAPEAAEAALNDALALWNGPVLADMSDAQFARIEIARLEQLRLAALEELVAVRLQLGRHHEVVTEVGGLVARHPERERLRCLQMLALYRCGRQREALSVYNETRTFLVEELGLEPGPELKQMERDVLAHDPRLEFALRPNVATRSGNVVKPLTSFVGRGRERASIEELLASRRLVTLTGTGGCGKTRLAIEVAVAVAPRFSDGVWMVDMASVPAGADRDAVASSVADAMGLRLQGQPGGGAADAVVAALTDRRGLIVVDNCEHLLDGARNFIRDLIMTSDDLVVLATSRETLRIPGEHTVVVAPLAVPNRGSGGTSSLGHVESVRLFVDRAAAVFAGFSLDEAVADSVAEVCRRVGGMPLAVELAAAQVAVFSVAQIAARIGRGPQGNGGAALPGQETIDASINWSYQLLDESERKIFEALSVFVGSFDVDAVEQLSEDGSAVRSFSNLVMKSLVLRDESDPGRYRLLEPLKQFAAARLEERGSASDVHALHTRMFAMLAAAAAPHLVGVAAPAWLARLDRDVENLRAALTWGFKAGGPHAHRAAAMAADIWMFWHLRGLMAEGRRWLEAALAVTGVEHHDLRVHVLFAAGVMAQGQGDFDAEVAWLSEALGIAESRNDPAAKCCLLSGLGGVAWARGDLDEAENYFAGSVAVGRPLHHWCASLAQAQRGRVAKDRGDFDVAVQLIQDGLGMARSIDFDMGIALALDFLAAVALARSDLDGASKLAHESLRHYRAIAYEEGIASVLQTIGRVAHWRGDDDGSTAAFGEVLVRCRQAGHRGGAAAGLEGVAAALAGRGPSGDAVQLFATASRLRGEIGAVPSQGDREQRDDILGRLRAELNTEFDVAWDLGSSLHLDEAIDLALRV